MVSKAARRYAKALLQSALEQDMLGVVKEDIQFINETLENSNELKVFLKSPVIKSEDKQNALSSIFEKHISKETMSLLLLLSEKRRENLLKDICIGFIQLYNEHQGIIRVDVVSAFELNSRQKKALEEELVEKTGKKVELDVTVNNNLIGGLIVKIGDTVIDGSVKHKIRMLKNQFAVNAAV